MFQALQAVRSRTLPEPKTSEAIEYKERHLQVCFSCPMGNEDNCRSQALGPIASSPSGDLQQKNLMGMVSSQTMSYPAGNPLRRDVGT